MTDYEYSKYNSLARQLGQLFSLIENCMYKIRIYTYNPTPRLMSEQRDYRLLIIKALESVPKFNILMAELLELLKNTDFKNHSQWLDRQYKVNEYLRELKGERGVFV